jgi:coenzyme F420-dependent glucose-6-phosphate dehydrogenase
MTAFGYTLSSEEHGPRDLVRNASRAEELGFDFVSISDHFHPWVSEQGHSPFVWSVLGGIASTTSRIEVAVGVTCPTIRIHPAIVAQAAATTSLLFDGRFSLGVGTGEALNEHVLGHRWPTPGARLEMLEEAVHVMRQLWSGDTTDHHGKYYDVENARLFDPPSGDLPVIVSAFGDRAMELAGRIGDGYWGHTPDADVVAAFEKAGGSGPRYAQINVCWAEDPETARQTVHRVWPNGGVPGQLSQDLPTWKHFEEAAQIVREEDAVGSTPCGPEVGPVLDSAQQYVDAGYDHVYFHQVGPDQDGFFDFWESDLGPALTDRFDRAPSIG